MLDFLLKAFHEFIIYLVAPAASRVVASFMIIWIRRGLLKKIFNKKVIKHKAWELSFDGSFFNI